MEQILPLSKSPKVSKFNSADFGGSYIYGKHLSPDLLLFSKCDDW